MGKARDFFKKITDIRDIFHLKMGTIKYRKCKDLTEAEDMRKSWKEYTGQLYKKGLNVPDNHDGVVAHLEPDILECEVGWALGNITTDKARGGDGVPAELFTTLKDDALKVLHSILQQIWKTQQWPQDWRRSITIPIAKSNARERSFHRAHLTCCQGYAQILPVGLRR